MSAPAVPPSPPPAPAPAPPPAPAPAVPPAPIPPVVRKPQVKKSDFERDTDAFNVVTDSSWLTHQNVHRLMRETFLKQGRSEAEVDRMFMETCALTDDADGEAELLTTVLKFIGQNPTKAVGSVALCLGGRRDPVTGKISGGNHWTALDLRMVLGRDGAYVLEATSMDSAGGVLPPAVVRVINMINKESIGDLSKKLNHDLQRNETIGRALKRLDAEVDGVRVNKAMGYSDTEYERQTDGNSCGYHAVFNLARMHAASTERPSPTLQQDGKQVGPAEFITARRRDLKAIFTGPVVRERAVAPTASDRAAADPTKAATAPATTTPDDEAAKIFKIIFDDDMNAGGRHVVKLKKLMEAEQRLIAGGEKNILLLSELQLEKHYERIICEWVEELKDKLRKGAAPRANINDELRFLDDLKTPEAFQNPKAVFEVLRDVSAGLVGDRDFLRTKKIGELKGRLEEAKKETDSAKNDVAKNLEELTKFFQSHSKKFPESNKIFDERRKAISKTTSSSDCKKLIQETNATIRTEKAKQKIFGELEFFGEKVDGGDNRRKFTCSDGKKYGFQISDKGIIEIFNLNAGANKVSDVKEQNTVLEKLEKEIHARKKQFATAHPTENFVKEADKITQAKDGSIMFKSTRTVDLSAKNPFKKFTKDDAPNWQETKKLDHDKVQMVKWNKLEKDDKRWELKDGKVKLTSVTETNAAGATEELKRRKGRVVVTTLDRDLMSYYLHGKSGAAVEEQKKKYGIKKTVEKLSDLEKPETVIKLISVRAMKERGPATRDLP